MTPTIHPLEQATRLVQQGRPREATDLIGQILKQDAYNSQAVLLLAQIHAQAGNLSKAVDLLRYVMRIEPANSEAHFGMGAIQQQRGNIKEAADWYERAHSISPNNPLTLFNLALTLQRLKKTEEAITRYRQVIALDPRFTQAHNNLGNIMLEREQLGEAAQCYEKVLAYDPDLVEANYNLGLVMAKRGRWDEAKKAYLHAIELRPGYAPALLAMGSLLHDHNDVAGAITYYEASIAADSSVADAHFNLGKACHDLGRFHEAMHHYREALLRHPTHAGATTNLGKSMQDAGRADDAIQIYQQALSIVPSVSAIYYNLGGALKRQGRVNEWIENFQNFALHDTSSLLYLMYAYQVAGHLGRFQEEETLLKKLLEYKYKKDNFLDLAQIISTAQYRDISQEELLALYRQFDALAIQGTGGERVASPAEDRAGRRVRLGYLSPDFKHHIMGKLIAAIFKHHDRQQFEIHAYALGAEEDKFTATLEGLCDHFVRIGKMNPRQAALRIAEDRLDLLVDLAALTDGCNPMILAYQPAPLQVTHLGYHGALGLHTVDYKITDRHADLPDNSDYLVEKLLPLDCCVMPFHHVEARPESLTRQSLGIPDDAILFGEFVSPLKLSRRCLAIWKTILDRVKGSRLAFSPLHPFDRDALLRRATAAGIAPDRIVFLPTGESEEAARSRYLLIDLVLDTFPYTGGDTTVAALDMSVPVVTLCGTRQSERMTSSILKHIGIEDSIAHSEAEFVEIACRLATDPSARSDLSERIKQGVASSRITDMGRYVRCLEKAYLEALATRDAT